LLHFKLVRAAASQPPTCEKTKSRAGRLPPDLILCAVLLAFLTPLLLWRPGLPLDDAHITMHNARALLAGGEDPTYAGATALTGATSAVHLTLVAAFSMVVSVPLASKLALLTALILYAAGLLEVVNRAQLQVASRLVLLCSGLIIAYMPYQLLNGLETGLTVAAITWALVLAESKWLPLLCGALPFVRPELAFLAGPLLGQRLWAQRKSPEQLMRSLALAVAGSAPWMLLYLELTGSILPNTGAAKVFFFAEAAQPLGSRLEVAAEAVRFSLLGPLFFGLFGLPAIKAGRAGLCFLVCWLTVAAITLPGGLWHNWFLYLSSTVPVLILGWTSLLANRSKVQMPAVAVLATWSVITSVAGLREYLNTNDVAARQRMVEAVLRNVPPREPILVHDAGYLAWSAPGLHLVDVVGLKSPSAVPWRAAVAERPQDRARTVSAIVRNSGARYFVVLAQDPFWGKLTKDLTEQGWQLRLVEAGNGRGDYSVYRIDRMQPR
jgi:hypothetical protein